MDVPLAGCAVAGILLLQFFSLMQWSGSWAFLLMPERGARAILAHGVAHVLRHDVRNQMLLWVALASAWVYAWVAISRSFSLGGPWWALASGIGWGGVLFLAGLYSRRCDLATDRLAAELIEDPEAMGAAPPRVAQPSPSFLTCRVSLLGGCRGGGSGAGAGRRKRAGRAVGMLLR